MQYRIAACAVALLIAGSAFAQTPSTPAGAKTPVASMAAGKSEKAPVVRTAKSLDCSKQADVKGLHGKPRKSFMSSCKKA
jgi:hypothetical protein